MATAATAGKIEPARAVERRSRKHWITARPPPLLSRALACLCGLAALAWPHATPAQVAATTPGAGAGLVVVLVVDQLRPDRIGPEMPGGLGRLLREGRRFGAAALRHAPTDTCPGHASILTGRHPGPAGIPGNRFFSRETREFVYCAADPSAAGVLLGGADGPFEPANGRSPRNLRVTSLGDWLREQRPGSRVYTISAKDRAAIMLGGQRPNAAYWLDPAHGGRFTTSRYYLKALPAWLERWNTGVLLAPLPARWTHASGDPPNGTRRDDYPGESSRFGRTSPHPLAPAGAGERAALARLFATPHLDLRTLALARELVIEEGLGRGAQVDLLAVSVSATDYIGHYYGPWSQEARDALERLDAELGDFIHLLERRVGRGRLWLVLTSDHGVMALPEWLRESQPDRPRCPSPNPRISPQALAEGLARHLHERLGGGEEGWLVRDGLVLAFDPAQAAARGVAMERVIELAIRHLERQPGVARAWRQPQVQAQPEPFATFYRNSVSEGRHGDLVIQPARGCLLAPYPAGTGHGSPYDYDRRVPLVFFGPGIEPGVSDEPAASVDIAPTLARQLGIASPPGLDGRPLPLRD